MTSVASARETTALPAIGALVLGAVAMGMSPTLVRLTDVGPFASAFWRVLLALPLLWLWMRVTEGEKRPKRRFSRAALLAGLAFAGDLIFWHLSIFHTSIANATFFATTAPLWVVVFGWLLFRDRVSAAVLVGLAFCLSGGAALIFQSTHAASGHVTGDIFGMLTGLFFGLYFLAVRAGRGDTGAARITFEMSIVAAAVLGVVVIATEDRLLPSSAAGWTTLLTLAVVSHAGGQGLLSFALGRLPAVFSSLVIFLEAIVAALVAWAVLGEPVTAWQALGGVLIVAGIVTARPRSDAHGVSK